MCKTLAGNDCEMLIITNFYSREEDIADWSAIIVSAWVHPGESNASFIMEGIIEFLVSNDPNALKLWDKFVFKIVPMLNPDGVIIGNYWCSISANDLNRQWSNPSNKYHPEIYATKTMIVKTLDSWRISFFCDIHGHSRSKNLFMYGCENKDEKSRLREKVFPLMFHKKCDGFDFDCCNFAIQKSKESTAWVVIWKRFNLVNSYTLECSFCGPTRGLYRDCHFTPSIMKDMGKSFCLNLIDFTDREQKKFNSAYEELNLMFPK